MTKSDKLSTFTFLNKRNIVTSVSWTVRTKYRRMYIVFQVLDKYFMYHNQTLTVSHRPEQLPFRVRQHVVTTVEDSVLRTEMGRIESQEEDSPRRVLWFKPMSWLGQIRSHHRD
jgi:hypothetical protein